MGRHSSPERTPFLRSLATWALPWLLIVGVITVALIVVFDMLGDEPIETASGTPAARSSAAPTPEPFEDAARGDKARGDADAHSEKGGDGQTNDDGQAKDDEDTEARGGRGETELITKDVQIQVLNGTSDPDVDDVMADKLARLGYSVVAVSPAARGYPETVVFWTGDAERIGAALADRYGWKLEPAPSNLSTEVELHVVVGDDAL